MTKTMEMQNIMKNGNLKKENLIMMTMTQAQAETVKDILCKLMPDTIDAARHADIFKAAMTISIALRTYGI